MIPTYHYSVSSMPFDLNYEDHSSHQLFNTNHNQASSSLPYSILYNPDQDQGGSYYWEPKPLQNGHQEAEKIVPSSGSWDHPAVEKDENYRSSLKLSVWKKEDGNIENLEGDHQEDSPQKWMPLKIRMKRRLMVSDQTDSDIAGISEHKHENQKLPLSPLGTDNSINNSSNHNSNITVRVCADCNTSKTPLWRGGPTGPKSLCNACGIRQRKARRALAAAAAANGATLVAAADQKSHVKGNHKLQIKGKKSKTELKKKHNQLGGGGRKKVGSEELTISSLSKNVLPFPQDEKEAAILLMALSHGFSSDRYLDLSS